MSPFSIAVISILTILFGLLSLTPVIRDSQDMDSCDSPTIHQAKGAH